MAFIRPNPPKRVFRRLMTATAGFAVVIVFSWVVFRPAESPDQAPVLRAARIEAPRTTITAPALDDSVVLWWLDPDTPVYFVLAPPHRQDLNR